MEKNFSASERKTLLIIILLMMTYQCASTIFIPAIPAIAAALKAPDAVVKFCPIAFAFGFGITCFINGLLADFYGRRTIQLYGVIIFISGCVLAMLAPSITILLAAMLIQGFGIGSQDIIGRAILCDLYDEAGFARAASYIGIASTLMPIIAPIMGGYSVYYVNWRANFLVSLILGISALICVYRYLPETLTKDKRSQPAPSLTAVFHQGWSNIRLIVIHKIFIGYLVTGIVAAFGYLAFTITAPFLIQNILHYDSVAFGWLTALAVSGIIIGSTVSVRLAGKLATRYCVTIGLSLFLVSGSLMLLLGCQPGSAIALIVPMMIFFIGSGIIVPNANAGAMSPFAYCAGVAGAMQSSLQALLVSLLATVFATLDIKTLSDFALIMALISLFTFIIFWLLMLHRPKTSKAYDA